MLRGSRHFEPEFLEANTAAAESFEAGRHIADASEPLLLWAFRRTVTHGAGCRLVGHTFTHSFGPDAAEIYATLCTLLQMLALSGRRRLRFGHPATMGTTEDELRLLSLIAAAQSGDAARLDAHLCWLAQGALCQPIRAAACALGMTLARHGHRIVPPEPFLPESGGIGTILAFPTGNARAAGSTPLPD